MADYVHDAEEGDPYRSVEAAGNKAIRTRPDLGFKAGFARFGRQSLSLTKKNVLIMARSAAATFTTIWIGVLFLILLVIIGTAIQATSGSDTSFTDTKTHSDRLGPKTFPNCTKGNGLPACFAFGYGSTRGVANESLVEAVVDHMITSLKLPTGLARNVPGGVLKFDINLTSQDVDLWILANQNVTKTIILFENSHQYLINPKSVLRYVLYTNSTYSCKEIGLYKCDEPWLDVHIPIMGALNSAIIAVVGGGDPNTTIDSSFSNTPHPVNPGSFNAMAEFGVLFLFVAYTFNYVTLLTAIVREKQNHLTESMRLMGMMKSAYWVSWCASSALINMAMVFLIMIAGVVLRLELFVKTDGAVLLTLFWLSAQAFSSWAMFLSSFIRTESTGRFVAVLTFIIVYVSADLFYIGWYQDPSQDYDVQRYVVPIFPPYDFYIALSIVIDAAAGSTQTGMRWENRADNTLGISVLNSQDTYWSLEMHFKYMTASIFGYVLLGWYLDQIIPNEYGRRQPPWFVFNPWFWGIPMPKCMTRCATACRNRRHLIHVEPMLDETTDPDVRVEAENVHTSKLFDISPPAVILRGLSKTFGKFKAVDNVFYTAEHGQLLALLGENGSGKSTTFNILTGLMDPDSHGSAEIFGRSIRDDMSVIHANMGVCPQHDVLWSQLTAREHLELFATIKGLNANNHEEIHQRLDQVKLTYAQNRRVGGYSGGMRRRLSIAIALLGDPAIVFLDECTTGMDSVTRAEVLDMISEAKEGRVMIMTSHAMEEVEMLADKVVVMSRGRIQAVGTTLRLKKRFGKGFVMSTYAHQSNVDKVSEYVLSRAPKGTTKDDVKTDWTAGLSAIIFRVPRPDDATLELIPFFSALEQEKTSVGIIDYSLALSTMEEVFLNLSKFEEDRKHEKDLKKWEPQMIALQNYRTKFTPEPGFAKTFQIQTVALFWKSWAFQRKNLCVCGTTICFPLIVILGLLLINYFLFIPLKVTAVCGSGISRENCARDGYDLSCVATLFEFRPTQRISTPVLGKIDLRGNRGNPINANCDSVTCYKGLEKMDFRNFPISGILLPSAYTLPNATLVKIMSNWYADALFVLSDTTCKNQYDDNFDQAKCNSVADRTQCIATVREMQKARDYIDATARDSFSISASTLLGACAPLEGRLVPPSQYFLDLVNAAKQELFDCQAQQRLQTTLPLFARQDIAAAIDSVVLNASVGSYSSMINTEQFAEAEWTSLTRQIWLFVNSLGPYAFGGGTVTPQSTTTFGTARAAWYNSMGVPYFVNETQFIPTLKELCQAPTAFGPQLLLIFAGNQISLNAFCKIVSNLNAVRLASVKTFLQDRNALDQYMYSSWFGKQVQTPYMFNKSKTIPKIQRYRSRHFYSKFGALHVNSLSSKRFSFVAYTNRTANSNVKTTNWKELTYLAHTAFVQYATNRTLEPRFKEMPPKFVCNRQAWLAGKELDLRCDMLPRFLALSVPDFVAGVLFPFLFLIFAFLIVQLLVYEKERRLRVILKMNGGLKSSVYWFVYFWFYFCQYIAMVFLMFVVGNVGRLRFTSLHDAGVFWLFAISWGFLLIAMSFLLSIFFSNTESSTAFVFLFILVLVLVGQELISNIISDEYSDDSSYAPLMWLPPFVLIRVTTWLATAGAFGEKIRFAELSTFANGAIAKSIGIMWGEFFACLILVWYLDNVYVAGFGTRKKWNFFLDRKYWGCSRKNRRVAGEEYDLRSIPQVAPAESLSSINNSDVQAEYERAVDQSPKNSANVVLRVVRLRKVFDSGIVAVKSVSFAIHDGSIFTLLGHNGAGKTSLINMLAGLYEPTTGVALLDGYSINHDMDAVQARMGICPQHDVVWDVLSVRNHLMFYARLKRVPRNELNMAVDKALFDVNLKRFEHRRADKLSGGMRRRLSTAMALIGAPRIVFCDEPSTGLDPASKRALWRVIENAKVNRSIFLTTHSMPEAEALSDRICIMALGEIQCLGTSSELKRRFGQGYTFFLQTDPKRTRCAIVMQYTESLFGGRDRVKLIRRPMGGSYKFEVAKNGVVLSEVFAEMEKPGVIASLGLLDWSISEITLDEVFLKLAEAAHVEEELSKVTEDKDASMFAWFWKWRSCKRRGGTSNPATEDFANQKPKVETKGGTGDGDEKKANPPDQDAAIQSV